MDIQTHDLYLLLLPDFQVPHLVCRLSRQFLPGLALTLCCIELTREFLLCSLQHMTVLITSNVHHIAADRSMPFYKGMLFASNA